MLQLKTVVCILVASVTGVVCLLVHNSEKQDQSAWFFDAKGHDCLEEQEDQSSDQGEPVWLLRHIDDEGNPRQWALYMFGKIFELRVVRNAPFPYAINCSPRFEAHVTDGVRLYPRTGFHHMAPERPCVGGTPESHLAYHLAGCYICMVGGTRLTPDQVQQAFRSVRDDFGVFIATFLCQSFLDKFLKEIIARRDRSSRRKKSIRQTKERTSSEPGEPWRTLSRTEHTGVGIGGEAGFGARWRLHETRSVLLDLITETHFFALKRHFSDESH
ncbi:hypothetical protein BHE90_010601 [Fusarium euwallaceae]|uniref:Uncharacterized protein n=3 Tax=Fusarium solani species complex TaxID=232080 RepID=A0A430LGY4_9HYPO|nr:hypothetical protein CEP51_006811 [Fusarium floridanum]RTE74967.1 hypothetical protein BHE90_010601 [Fusarium euwallaceae]